MKFFSSPLCLLPLLAGVNHASPSNPSISLTRISMPCPDLAVFNSQMRALMNLTAPAGTPQSILPQVNTRLAAMESFSAGYMDLVNAFSPVYCAANTNNNVTVMNAQMHVGTGNHTSLVTRQDMRGVLESICTVLESVEHMLEEVIAPIAGFLDSVEDAIGCGVLSSAVVRPTPTPVRGSGWRSF
ncbi:uncharacterized protein DSM5745_00251 [Aspergillus mulundensis]|uniref:Uncharacterized protein n=1 Tax=Aspergillus mulundensis TaxID=1810919 RepID=A0A3D8T329_9EURO|nr:hypothetical protein DSM5745_00251 [Aspergillus mulundensis]RDW92929.1 hypothetical protein DSM5745_00251 [Aspergillus mulundensis]